MQKATQWLEVYWNGNHRGTTKWKTSEEILKARKNKEEALRKDSVTNKQSKECISHASMKRDITQSRVQIFIKRPCGKTGTVETPSQATIRTLKRAASLITAIPTREFYMVYGGKKLTKKRTLTSYGIENMSTVFMMLRCKGGGPSLNHSSWVGATATNPTALATYLETKQATQGNLQGLWKDENAPARYATELDSTKTKENSGLSLDGRTRRILDHSFQPVIQPNGVGGYGGIYPQSRFERVEMGAHSHYRSSEEDFTTTLQWTVLTPCPAKGCLAHPLTLTTDVPTMREATHVYDWTTTLRAVQKNLNRDQTLPTFHDDRLTHNLLWSIATIHLKLEITNEHGRHLGCSQHLTQSWAEGGDHHPTLLESTRLLNDGWIRECRTHTHSSLFYEFILPARGCEVITNGVRFMVYGPWTTLEEACHAREWLAMMVFAGRSQEEHIFPISASLPNETITIPSLFSTKAQATFRMAFNAHRLMIGPTHLHRSPLADTLLDSHNRSSFPYRFLDRSSKGILISSEAARRMFFYIQFIQYAETFRRYNNVYRFEAMQLRAGHPDKKRRKFNIVQLSQSIKEIISLALQTLIIVTKDWAFCPMAEGTGSYQRSAYIPDQTRLTVSSSPVKYLLDNNNKVDSRTTQGRSGSSA
jgi:hypothetical protein